MAEWGRKEYSKKWPSRRPVWTWTAIFLTGIFFFGVFCLDYSQGWTAAERLYLMDYLKSGAAGGPHLAKLPQPWVPHVSLLRHGLRSSHARRARACSH